MTEDPYLISMCLHDLYVIYSDLEMERFQVNDCLKISGWTAQPLLTICTLLSALLIYFCHIIILMKSVGLRRLSIELQVMMNKPATCLRTSIVGVSLSAVWGRWYQHPQRVPCDYLVQHQAWLRSSNLMNFIIILNIMNV